MDDPTGTKYMEIITNAMPSFFSSMPTASLRLIRGLMKFDRPQTYEDIFAGVDRQQVIIVTGEEDNTFTPAAPPPSGEWKGLEKSATVAKNEEQRLDTGVVPAGVYTFTLSGTAGDADLYVRLGQSPTTASYDCRPYKAGSNETCSVTVTTPSTIHAMVRGWAATSTYKLVARKN